MGSTLKKKLRELLACSGARPQKSWGQNFVVDESVLEQIVRAADPTPNDVVLEIGAGTGFLTRELATRVGKVIALELEHDMFPILQKQLEVFANVDLLFEDGAEYNPGPGPYKLVANIPYQITGRLVRHYLTEVENKPSVIVLLIQKEVARKATAEPPDANLFSMSILPFATSEFVAEVDRSAFYPIPKVDSAILRLDVLPKKKIRSDEGDYFRLLHACFHSKRKQLINSFSGGLDIKKEQAAEVLKSVGIDPTRRPQTLSLEEWDRLAGTTVSL